MSRIVRWGYRGIAAALDGLGLKTAVRTQVLPKLISAAGMDPQETGPESLAVAHARRELARLAETDRPILVGPWLSEVGFELLYWIPFLRWAARTYGLDRDRMIAVSRGGAGLWYEDICGRSVDLFDLVSVDAFVQGNTERWQEAQGQKQGFATAFESECLDRAVKQLGLPRGDFEVLPPSLMHNIFWHVWAGRAPLDVVAAHSEFRTQELEADGSEQLPDLPRDFVAARFYGRESFPSDDDNRRFVEHLLDRLTARSDVVLLNTRLSLDDHEELTIPDRPRLHRIEGVVDAASNLALQTRIIARSRLFVGTYGGMAYLAPLLGVPSVSFFSTAEGLKPLHGELASRVFDHLGGSFTKLSTAEFQTLDAFGL